MNDGRFAIWWWCPDAEMDEGKIIEGALFHKPDAASRLAGQ